MKLVKLVKLVKIVMGIVAAFGVATGAQAQEQEINPWQDCGLGAMVFPENTTAAAISNIIWDLGSTAITSKLSSPDTCEGDRVKAAMFIQRTYAELETETAVGAGEHLVALTELYGCSADVQAPIIEGVRLSMAASLSEPAFASLDRSQKAERFFVDLERVISTDHAESCTVI